MNNISHTNYILVIAHVNKLDHQNPHKRVNELKIPNVSSPNGGNSPTTLKEQLKANVNYLKKLQVDMNRQVDIVNQEFIDQQPVQPDQINKTKKFPNPQPLEELQKLLPATQNNDPSVVQHHPGTAPFSLPKIAHNVLHPNSLGMHRDLIGNMNIKGNMDQLKKLMKTMANDVQESNVAIVNRQRKKNKALAKEKNKNKTQKNTSS